LPYIQRHALRHTTLPFILNFFLRTILLRSGFLGTFPLIIIKILVLIYAISLSLIAFSYPEVFSLRACLTIIALNKAVSIFIELLSVGLPAVHNL
jgi:hypothetical protein